MGKINNFLYFLVFLLTFTGYYAILLLVFNVGLANDSRLITVPLRLGIMLLLFISLISNIHRLHTTKLLTVFFFFSVLYLIRLLVDYIKGVDYYIPISNVILYFLSFAVIPFLVIVSQNITKKQLKTVFNALLIGGFFFSILSVIFYNQFVGSVGRLATGRVGEAVLSPLALSYTACLTIGVVVFYWMHHKIGFYKKILFFGVIGLAVIPFFLGASRGSLFALFVPFLISFYYSVGAKNFFKILFIFIVALIALVLLDNYLGSGLLGRFLSIEEAIKTGDSSALRIVVWQSSWEQFLKNPIFGDSIVVDFRGWRIYPHNLFLEVLQSLGILGFIPFIILVGKVWKSCLNIFKNHKELTWIAVIFIQAFMQNLFSGAIFTATWTWTSMALIFAVDYALKRKIL